jgi:hypothetical protein
LYTELTIFQPPDRDMSLYMYVSHATEIAAEIAVAATTHPKTAQNPIACTAHNPNGTTAIPLNGHPNTTATTHATHARLCSPRSVAAHAAVTHVIANELGSIAVDAIAIPELVASIIINTDPTSAFRARTALTSAASAHALASPSVPRPHANAARPASSPSAHRAARTGA